MVIIWDQQPEPNYAPIVIEEPAKIDETEEADDEPPKEKSPCQESGKGFGK